MNELVHSGLLAAGYTLAFLIIFIGFYWAFRGFPPASRVVMSSLPTENDLKVNQATFKFFYVAWCPYSEDAVPKVESLRDLVKDYTYGGKTVQVELINCDTDKKQCQLYKIESYPTYKLETSSKLFEYLGPPTVDVYRQFIISALGSESKK